MSITMNINKNLLMYISTSMIVVGVVAVLYAGYTRFYRHELISPVVIPDVESCTSFLRDKGLIVIDAPIVEVPSPEATMSAEASPLPTVSTEAAATESLPVLN